ncbi:hypothetical protein CPB86DRAFT_807338 [Serendipita vermifera]|nr:hypothetical protein CPB86DRAFT_807338 [Serendipita vermifera]
MAARKLQGEMDRTFKKIQEGVENFEDIESKMNAAGTPAQKEKMEADLKTQIKKLQRLRDQLKTWQAGSDVKDKAPIIDHRRLIEVQMERFKAIEKEMKTKQYSTIGLISHSKLDPKEQQRLDLVQWLQGKVEELQQQVESTEAELETLRAGAKKRGKGGDQARTEQLELLNERRNWHISQLEVILRLVENSSLKLEDVENVKEDVDFFVTNNAEDDFEYDDGVYAELNLENYVEVDMDNESTVASDIEDDHPPRISVRKSAKVEDEDSKDEISSKKASAARPRAKSSTKPLEAAAPKPPVPTTTFTQPMSAVVKSGSSAQRAPTLPLRYAAAAAMGTSTASHTNASATNAPQNAPSAIPVARAPSPPVVTTTTSSTSATNPLASSSTSTGQQATNSVDTPASDQAAPLSPSEVAASSVIASPALSPVAIKDRDREPSTGGGSTTGITGLPGSYTGAPSAASVTSMSLASPVVSVVEATGASPQASKISNSATSFTHDPSIGVSSSNPSAQGLSSQGILPPPGLSLNGSREIGNLSSVTAKSEHDASKGAILRTGAPNLSDDPAPSSALNVGNGVGAIGSPSYPNASTSPVASTNGQEDRAQPPIGNQQPPRFAATLSDLMTSFKTAGLKGMYPPERMRDSEQVNDVLEMMSPSMPQPRDAERPKYHATRNPIQTPSYYPQQMLPLLASPEFFERLDVETLFWVFYYMPGTYQQWLAAQELKKQSWRFHVKFLTWFQRHAKPDEVTDEYEQGQYLYFDWEGSWCVRKKSDFRFEYKNLSDD